MGKPGRPKGRKNDATLEREAVAKAVQQKIFKMADKLVDSQMIVSMGTHRMCVITKGPDGKPSLETIRDSDRFNVLLETGKYGVDYIILAAADPDWKAGDALLNRALGKAPESVDITTKGQPIVQLSDIVAGKHKIKPDASHS